MLWVGQLIWKFLAFSYHLPCQMAPWSLEKGRRESFKGGTGNTGSESQGGNGNIRNYPQQFVRHCKKIQTSLAQNF